MITLVCVLAISRLATSGLLPYHGVTVGITPYSAPVHSSYYQSQDDFGQYVYGYASHGHAKDEMKTADGVTRGGYSYIDANGILQTVQYISDPVNGFRVSATNIPRDLPEVALAKAQHYHAYENIKRQHAEIAAQLSGGAIPLSPIPVGNSFIVPIHAPVAPVVSRVEPIAYVPKEVHYIQVPVSNQYHSQDNHGQYSYGYAGPLSSKSEFKSADGVTKGGYSYIDANGVLQSVQYISDPVNGFRVQATNLPQAPEVTLIGPKVTTSVVNPQKSSPLLISDVPHSHAPLVISEDTQLPSESFVNPVILKSSPENQVFNNPERSDIHTIPFRSNGRITTHDNPQGKFVRNTEDPQNVALQSQHVPVYQTPNFEGPRHPGYPQGLEGQRVLVSKGDFAPSNGPHPGHFPGSSSGANLPLNQGPYGPQVSASNPGLNGGNYQHQEINNGPSIPYRVSSGSDGPQGQDVPNFQGPVPATNSPYPGPGVGTNYQPGSVPNGPYGGAPSFEGAHVQSAPVPQSPPQVSAAIETRQPHEVSYGPGPNGPHGAPQLSAAQVQAILNAQAQAAGPNRINLPSGGPGVSYQQSAVPQNLGHGGPALQAHGGSGVSYNSQSVPGRFEAPVVEYHGQPQGIPAYNEATVQQGVALGELNLEGRNPQSYAPQGGAPNIPGTVEIRPQARPVFVPNVPDRSYGGQQQVIPGNVPGTPVYEGQQVIPANAPGVHGYAGQQVVSGHAPSTPVYQGQQVIPGNAPGTPVYAGQQVVPGNSPGTPVYAGHHVVPGQAPGAPVYAGQQVVPGQAPGTPVYAGQQVVPGQAPGTPVYAGQQVVPGQASGAPVYAGQPGNVPAGAVSAGQSTESKEGFQEGLVNSISIGQEDVFEEVSKDDLNDPNVSIGNGYIIRGPTHNPNKQVSGHFNQTLYF